MFQKLAVTVVATLFSISASYADEWVRLGERNVGFIADHDTIHVGKQDGKFKRLKLVVHRNDISLKSVKVIFGNGEVEDVVFDRHIHEGGDAVIDLPHRWREGRSIESVELRYHSRPDFRGEALAELWGQEDESAPSTTPVAYGHHDWVKLGDRHVGFINDHDTIPVGRRDGKFTRLKLVVHGNGIKLNSIKVFFGNGDVEDIPYDRQIHDGGEAVIDLHGSEEGRFIRDVELHYHSQLDFHGKAIAELWGQQG